MMSLFNSFHVRAVADDGARREFGRPIDDGVYLLPFPQGSSVELGEGPLVTVKPTQAKGGAVAHGRVVEKYAAHVERRHAIAAAEYDDAGRERRHAALRAFVGEFPGCDARIARHAAEHAAEYSYAALALEPGHALPNDVLETLVRGGLSEAEVRDAFARVLERGTSAYESNKVGATLDAAAARVTVELEQARVAGEAVRIAEEALNDLTLDQVNAVGIRIRDGAQTELIRLASGCVVDGGCTYLFVARGPMLSASFAPQPVGLGIDVLPGDFVPNVKKSAMKKAVRAPTSPLRNWLMGKLRWKERAIVQGTADYSTTEGRARIEQWLGAVQGAELASDIVADVPAEDAWTLAVSGGREGFAIAKDIIALELSKELVVAWTQKIEPQRIEHELRQKAYWTEGQLGYGYGRKYQMKPWIAPAMPERYLEENVLARLDRSPAWFDENELYVRDESALAAIASWIGLDPFRKVINAIEGDVVRSAQIEDALLAAKLVDGPLTPKEHVRVHKLMTGRGYSKRDVPIDGVRTKAFVKDGAK